MKIEFDNSVRRLSFLCRLTDIRIAWINPWQCGFLFLILTLNKVASFRNEVQTFLYQKGIQQFFNIFHSVIFNNPYFVIRQHLISISSGGKG